MSSPFIQFHTQDGIAHIRLNRPDVLNALTRDMLRGIAAALDEAANDASIRAIILSGAGRAFAQATTWPKRRNCLTKTFLCAKPANTWKNFKPSPAKF